MILPHQPHSLGPRAIFWACDGLQEGKVIVWVTTWPPQLCGTQEGAHFLSSPSMNWITDFRTGDWEESGTPDRVLGGCWRNMVHTVLWTPSRNHKLLGMHHSGSPQLVHKHPQLLAQLIYTHAPTLCPAPMCALLTTVVVRLSGAPGHRGLILIPISLGKTPAFMTFPEFQRADSNTPMLVHVDIPHST